MRDKLRQTIRGKIYDTERATLIASDEYWDGNNWERRGTNTHLYRTARGAYFVGHSTRWIGSHSHISPISEADALELYEQLREHDEEYEEAFPGRVAEEA